MKQHYAVGLLLWVACFLLTTVAVAQGAVAGTDSPNRSEISADTSRLLFARDSTLHFTLTANLRPLLKDRGDTPTTHTATLTYTDERQKPVSLPLTLKVRGNFRRSRTNCSFPPLLIDLPKKKTGNTLFAHQNKLKLVTHCQVDEWVVREYLVYKLYNLLADLSFRARLAQVTYADSAGKRAPETHWAFLLEDDDAVAKRNGANVSKMKQISMSYTDSLRMATVGVFEYMIGNTDWSVPYLHNIRLIDTGGRGLVPVPYDFDHAGIVEAAYALPAEQLAIQSVRQRLYRGLAYPMAVFQKVFDQFNQAKPQFYALYTNDTRLSPAYVKRTLNYLDEFYAVINKPASARSEFQQGDRSGVVIKGLN